jgi:hypothetical protein
MNHRQQSEMDGTQRRMTGVMLNEALAHALAGGNQQTKGDYSHGTRRELESREGLR